MNTDIARALERLSKASRHAHRLRTSLDKLTYLVPEAHGTWHEMAHETRRIELRLETLLTIIEDILGRDVESSALLILMSERPPDSALREV